MALKNYEYDFDGIKNSNSMCVKKLKNTVCLRIEKKSEKKI